MKTILFSAALMTSIASAAIAGDKPITLKAMGSFYVGGQRIEITHSGGIGSNRPGHI